MRSANLKTRATLTLVSPVVGFPMVALCAILLNSSVAGKGGATQGLHLHDAIERLMIFEVLTWLTAASFIGLVSDLGVRQCWAPQSK
jgi:hypothetical protein